MPVAPTIPTESLRLMMSPRTRSWWTTNRRSRAKRPRGGGLDCRFRRSLTMSAPIILDRGAEVNVEARSGGATSRGGRFEPVGTGPPRPHQIAEGQPFLVGVVPRLGPAAEHEPPDAVHDEQDPSEGHYDDRGRQEPCPPAPPCRPSFRRHALLGEQRAHQADGTSQL